MLKKEQFAVTLKARYVPHYAWPRIEPERLWEYYTAGIISAQRVVRHGSQNIEQIVRVGAKVQKNIYDTLIRMRSIHPTLLEYRVIRMIM